VLVALALYVTHLSGHKDEPKGTDNKEETE